MTNWTHTKRLREGVTAWNQWRLIHPEIRPELAGIWARVGDLSGINLSGADLRHADLQGADLSGADLRGADLRFANLQHANLEEANLYNAQLYGANLEGALVDGADFTNTYRPGRTSQAPC